MQCPRCNRILMGVVHGDQVDIGGRAVAVETVKDQRRARSQAPPTVRAPRQK
jgi:hypothetical protein